MSKQRFASVSIFVQQQMATPCPPFWAVYGMVAVACTLFVPLAISLVWISHYACNPFQAHYPGVLYRGSGADAPAAPIDGLWTFESCAYPSTTMCSPNMFNITMDGVLCIQPRGQYDCRRVHLTIYAPSLTYADEYPQDRVPVEVFTFGDVSRVYGWKRVTVDSACGTSDDQGLLLFLFYYVCLITIFGTVFACGALVIHWGCYRAKSVRRGQNITVNIPMDDTQSQSDDDAMPLVSAYEQEMPHEA